MDAFRWSCLLCFLIGGALSGDDAGETPEEVSAVLGEDVTLSVLPKIDYFSWLFNGETIARKTPGTVYKVWDTRFDGRLYVMDGNGSLNIRNLKTEDSGRYKIEIFNMIKKEKENKYYNLKLFSRVKALIIPSISPDSTNDTCLISFNCTVNDTTNVSYSWSGEKVGPSVEPVMSLSLTESESNPTVCCTVKNPASEDTQCALPRKHCFPDSAASTCTTCTCGFPERIVACASAAVICALLGFIVY